MNSGKQIFDLYNRCHLPSAETIFVVSQLYSDCMNREEEAHMGDYKPAVNDSLNDFPPGCLEHRLKFSRSLLSRAGTAMQALRLPLTVRSIKATCGDAGNEL